MRESKRPAILEMLKADPPIPHAVIAERHGVSPQYVGALASRYGLLRVRHANFTAEELARAQDLYARDMPISHIAQAIGKPQFWAHLRSKLVRMGVHTSTPYDKWDDHKTAVLIEGYNKLQGAELAALLGISVPLLRAKARRFGLTRPRNKALISQIRRALRINPNLTNLDIARMLGVDRRRVILAAYRVRKQLQHAKADHGAQDNDHSACA